MIEARARLSVTGASLAEDGPVFDDEFAGGEIVGLAGLDGHGQEAFLEALAGWRPLARGEIALVRDGAATPIRGFRRAAASGVGYLPRDRRTSGLFPNLSVLDNFAIASIARDLRFGLIDRGARRRRFEALRRRLSIVVADPDHSIAHLSGGNQQKVLLARLLARDPVALLLNDPTRGVDVATRRMLYRILRELAESGMALVMVSTEIQELIELCDRILVFRENRLSKRLPVAGLTSDRLIAAMFGEA
jgi:ribose transport system ATP-binding protein